MTRGGSMWRAFAVPAVAGRMVWRCSTEAASGCAGTSGSSSPTGTPVVIRGAGGSGCDGSAEEGAAAVVRTSAPGAAGVVGATVAVASSAGTMTAGRLALVDGVFAAGAA